MKAVLVIDMPSRCFNCPLHQVIDDEEKEHEFMVFCNAEHWREPITHQPVENLEERPSWCPLKPIHRHKGCMNYSDGWNACLDELIGEE